MNIEELRLFCLSLPGTTEGMKWGHLCFMIEEKLYIIIGIDEGNRFSIKCETEEFEELSSRDGIEQASHMAKGQWISVQDLNVFGVKELKERILKSRSLILKKMSKKVQEKYVDLS